MPILVLDLDLTSIVQEEHLSKLNKGQVLSAPIPVYLDDCNEDDEIVQNKVYIRLINPKKLSRLIEDSFQKYNGIMILTSGLWNKESILKAFARHLDLSPVVRKKLINSKDIPFHTPLTDCLDYSDISSSKKEVIAYIKSLLKGVRLKELIENNYLLKNKHFIFLNDSKEHLESCMDMPNVHTIRARTRESADTTFYTRVEQLLFHAAQMETKSTKNLYKRNNFFHRKAPLNKKRKMIEESYSTAISHQPNEKVNPQHWLYGLVERTELLMHSMENSDKHLDFEHQQSKQALYDFLTWYKQYLLDPEISLQDKISYNVNMINNITSTLSDVLPPSIDTRATSSRISPSSLDASSAYARPRL